MDSGSPADRAGLKDGELLLEVNGESVESLRHEEIVDRVRLSGKQVSLTTISVQGLDFYTKVSITYASFFLKGPVCKIYRDLLAEYSRNGI